MTPPRAAHYGAALMNRTLLQASILMGLSLLAAAGCGGNWQQNVEAKVAKQASFDLQCDASKLQLQQIDENAIAMGHMYTYGVRGCDKQATYKGMCASMGGCNVMNEAQLPKQ